MASEIVRQLVGGVWKTIAGTGGGNGGSQTIEGVLTEGDDAGGLNLLNLGSLSSNSATLDSGGLSINNDGNIDLDTGDVNVTAGKVKTNLISPASGSIVTIDDGVDIQGSTVKLTSLPTSDPAVVGALWRSGNDLKISTG